jgi:hypothetical protein
VAESEGNIRKKSFLISGKPAPVFGGFAGAVENWSFCDVAIPKLRALARSIELPVAAHDRDAF